jgi:hypothetical protein
MGAAKQRRERAAAFDGLIYTIVRQLEQTNRIGGRFGDVTA